MPHLRNLILAALVALAAVPTIACSSNSASIIPADVVRAAADRATQEQTVSFEMTMTMDGILFMGDMEITSSGSMDLARYIGFMSLDADGLSFETITTPEAVYTRMSFLGAGSEKWVRLDLTELGVDPSALMGNQGADPASLLAHLKGVSDEVKTLGQATVRGVATTHYRATIVLDRAWDYYDDADPRLGDSLRQMAAGFPDSYVVDLWVDSEGLMRKMEYEIELDASGFDVPYAGGSLGTHLVIEFFDYGKPVDIAVPSDDEVISLEQWIEDMASTFGEWE